MVTSEAQQIVCFGEVLWDVLPAGAVPGGAPVNVAYHLQKLSKTAAVISRIGHDKNGDDLKKVFSELGVNTHYFQGDEKYSTGLVYANTTDSSEVVYDIVMPSAWDFIALNDDIISLAKAADYFVFGSLASRQPTSQATLFALLEVANKKVLDINLRSPHYQRPLLESLLHKADILKLNAAELDIISGWQNNFSDVYQKIDSIKKKFLIDEMIVTLGEDGAILSDTTGTYIHPGYTVTVADTIGSGDAFLAALLSGFINGKKPEEVLAYASGLGAFIATQHGACPEYELSQVTALMDDTHAHK